MNLNIIKYIKYTQKDKKLLLYENQNEKTRKENGSTDVTRGEAASRNAMRLRWCRYRLARPRAPKLIPQTHLDAPFRKPNQPPAVPGRDPEGAT